MYATRQFTLSPVPAVYFVAEYVIAEPPVGVKPVVAAGTIGPVAERVVEICTTIVPRSVGVVVPPPPLNVIVGLVVYPEPPLVIVTPVILPPETTAVPVAATPPVGGAEKVTVGALVYPVPIPDPGIVTLDTGPLSVTIPAP